MASPRYDDVSNQFIAAVAIGPTKIFLAKFNQTDGDYRTWLDVCVGLGPRSALCCLGRSTTASSASQLAWISFLHKRGPLRVQGNCAEHWSGEETELDLFLIEAVNNDKAKAFVTLKKLFASKRLKWVEANQNKN